MSTHEGEKKMPEWSIFDRLDEVEEITLKLMEKADTTEPTLKKVATMANNAMILAKYAFMLGPGIEIANAPNPRKTKDAIIHLLKRAGLRQETLDWLNELLIVFCEDAEKEKL